LAARVTPGGLFCECLNLTVGQTQSSKKSHSVGEIRLFVAVPVPGCPLLTGTVLKKFERDAG